MGIAVVGGMLTSTFLTLLVIPVVYTLLSDLVAKIKPKTKHEPKPEGGDLREVMGK
jgi:hypothetical protein